MVMIFLNQAASQISNRILDNLIGNRFQQSVLGVYIGTIVYALFLLSTIRDIDSGIYVPATSTYFLIALTVVDIFLFIYFLHYVTQSVKYDTIMQQICDTTSKSLEAISIIKDTYVDQDLDKVAEIAFRASKSGIFQGFFHEDLVSVCRRENIIISFKYPVGTFIIEGIPLLTVNRNFR